MWGQRGIYVRHTEYSYSFPTDHLNIQAIIALHVVLYLSESLPFLQILFSICCHVVYLQNFSSQWPMISLSSLSFMASCTLVILDHFMWFFHFSKITQEARVQRYRKPNVPGFAEIATFFGVCVWLAPVFLFLSLSANDNALPTKGTLWSIIPHIMLTCSQIQPRRPRLLSSSSSLPLLCSGPSCPFSPSAHPASNPKFARVSQTVSLRRRFPIPQFQRPAKHPLVHPPEIAPSTE